MRTFLDHAAGQKESSAEFRLAEYTEKICASQEAVRKNFWKGALESPSILAWIVDHAEQKVQVLP